MQRGRDAFDIREGTKVVASDGQDLGKVGRLEGDTIVVQKGAFFPQDYYIPTSAVTSVDDDTVHLSVTGDMAMAQDWGQTASNVRTSGAVAGQTDDDLEVDPKPFTHEQDNPDTHINARDDIQVPIIEEELAAQTREVQRGEVRVHKDVVEEQQSIEVPVTEEEVEITRRRVDRPVTNADHAFEDETISVPLRGEEVDVQKQARVVEEIDVDKTTRQHTEQASGTVRREEVQVDGENVDVERTNQKDRKKRS